MQWILTHERGPEFVFASQTSSVGKGLLDEFGLAAATAGEGTMVLIDGGRAYVRSDAALRIAGRMRAPWRWLALWRVVPRPMRDWVYRKVARNRHRLGVEAGCLVPTEEQRLRFLDLR
ncbi:MAG: DUF393 domain-containing protein [Phycisphaeraceae bacterium]|nr:DUF393 domain-containing protein [Phycisphaeraceae bacterium]MCW5763609.1 DUF393 domain-containing protein [Phycisphaeraceae bacterium]